MTDKENFIANASIGIMTALLETTKHNVIEEPVMADIYASASVRYATALYRELEKSFMKKDD